MGSERAAGQDVFIAELGLKVTKPRIERVADPAGNKEFSRLQGQLAYQGDGHRSAEPERLKESSPALGRHRKEELVVFSTGDYRLRQPER